MMQKRKYSLFSKDLLTDYSMESHTKDLEIYASISRGKRKRARAILDFERKDDDELVKILKDNINLIFIKAVAG
jgi:hypothetical protein